MVVEHRSSAPRGDTAAPADVTEQALDHYRDLLMERFPLPAPRPRRRKAPLLLALLMVAAVSVWWADPAYRTEQLTTAVGQQMKVDLADGSHVALNTETRLELAWHLRSRRVTLQQGQALFDVEHKFYRPFTVDAGTTHVTVVGTMFDVWRKPQSVQVTVLRGRVQVRSDGAPLYLTANQQTQVVGQQLAQVTSVDAATETVWQDGKLIFDRTPLRDVLQEMQRYSENRIAPVDETLGRMQVSGVFQIARAEAMLDLLPTILPVTVTRARDTITIRAR
jgi:transmembrane sensor